MQLVTWQRVGVGLMASWGLLAVSGADAQAAKRTAANDRAGTYSLEFRSRDSEIVGHSYVVARQTAANGRVVSQRVSGFRPANIDTPVSQTVRGVAGAVGTYREDFSKRPTLSYKVDVSAGQYRRAMAKIGELQRKPPAFRALSQNCNAFLGDVAKAARLTAPSSIADRPESYVSDLRELNGGDRASGRKGALRR
jgi:hypothetical protein